MFFRRKSFYIKYKKVLIVVGIILVVVVVGFRNFSQKNDKKSVEETNQSVSLISLQEYKQNSAVVKGTGEVEAVDQVELKSEVSATVSSVLVSIGDKVVAGQPLVYFKNGELASQYEQAKADLERAKVSKEQLEFQYQMAMSSQSRTESNALSAITSAQAAYDLAENNLQLNSTESSSKIVKKSYDTVVPIIKTFYSTLRTSLLDADSILGIKVVSANDKYKNKISLNDVGALNIADSQFKRASVKIDDIYDLITNLSIDSNQVEIDNAIMGINDALGSIDILWDNLDVVLSNSTGSDIFDSLKVVVDAGNNDVVNVSTGLVNVRQTLDNAKSSLTGVEITYNKAIEDLKETKIRAEADVNSSLAQLNQAETAIRMQDTAIARAQAVVNGIGSSLLKTTIKSPISGTVAVLPAKAGELITPGSLVASIVNVSGLQIRSFVDSSDVSKVSVNAPVVIAGNIKGVVTNVAPSIDPKTRKVEVLVAVSEPELSKFVVGQYVDIDIEEITKEEDNNIIRLPLKSIDVTDNGAFVFGLNNENIVEKHEVVLSRVIGTDVEVISGLENIETIIKSVRGIKEGDKVDIIK
ncbi:MAG: hypothetical protein A2725_04115 [Candidatus Magasanikbacteria bacterium RIFCSPHIGHO2_01_FULL_33_34]|uniref:Multidrug resistance protein MdtA-like C-terminal permuted SH3 domain-containing protein n=1 Tax=Candidatus Magasanikbacteria bacterium RIFCSPHIGHO2_01_FULL_33_34 TaxID=1798671 RepID=A0A1F6LHX6_9BACT|nr:MAG: hypothetical protein A2725_04115 [Candidatus Magasanikbacteria bacterium RIFCSPHIGHO2_01_FULL_33_34]OGH65151.1 MAG: hypothetical protein A3B83_03875 [Candidatus Magasanikbacteria bacterium RIFCSPHIGHO2_02_FULL_33_17]OGH75305.1 MAG: hypothetical protein A3A89_04290 [Candidatus Magasanikbacteria bacterium RIFCSPLOWO2_01_FULL_33_34]OGH81718.1 MAG: hypothetical protein A3F93_03150 [Candidatus Magasanikbacteria bacterium RIFCSPLOWO2_12_FULL_34_7]